MQQLGSAQRLGDVQRFGALWGCAMLAALVVACRGGGEQSGMRCGGRPCRADVHSACFALDDGSGVCACGDGRVDNGAGGCRELPITADGTGVDWTSDAPTYTARVRVADIDGSPIEGASVRYKQLMVSTDATGRARFVNVDATEAATLHVTKAGLVPHVRQVRFDTAGQKESRLVLVAEAPVVQIDPTQQQVVKTPSALLSLPADALMQRAGKRPAGVVDVRATSIDRKSHGPDAVPGLPELLNERGQRAPLKELHHVLRVELHDEEGEELQLRPGKFATLSVALPADSKHRAGDTLSLYALDEVTQRWSKQSTCRVQENTTASRASGDRPRDCVGAVPHFSTWAVGEEWDVNAPGELGCFNLSVDWTLPAGVSATQVQWHVLECDADGCDASGSRGLWSRGYVQYVPPVGDSAHSLCGVVGAAGRSYRWVVEFDLEVASSASTSLRTGRVRVVRDISAPAAFNPLRGADLALIQGRDAADECANVCVQQALNVTEAELREAANDGVFVDVDGDGFYARVFGEGDNSDVPEDCDDSDPRVYPGAPEGLCSLVDNNCDGVVAPVAGRVTFRDVSDPFRFNAYCGESCVITEAEVPGNLYDEDCDGLVDDADGDGVLVSEGDCDDWNVDVNPSGNEVPGNVYDEDCDGETLDADGDGYFAWSHLRFAQMLGIDPATQPERFEDCLDSDPDTHPGVDVSQEVGQLAALYYVSSAGGSSELRRAETFCGYFLDSGRPSPLFANVRDRNCDGVVSDLDGDGFTVPGDNALGVDNAIDCNDLDVRVVPVPADPTAGTPATCVAPNPALLVNDSDCTVNLDRFGAGDLAAFEPDGCPARLGGFIETDCWQIGGSTGPSLCLYSGWDTQPPLKWTAGEVWGACDEINGGLPDCPMGSVCAGPLPYTSEYTAYVTARYTTPLSQNTCFKSCSNPIGSL